MIPADELICHIRTTSPDLPGCFSAGDNLDEALTNARDAILLHLDRLLDDGLSFPKPSTIEQLRSKRSYRGWTWAIVDVSELGPKAAIGGL
jgi:predicted RNase H-like HicB family nuclease